MYSLYEPDADAVFDQMLLNILNNHYVLKKIAADLNAIITDMPDDPEPEITDRNRRFL